MELKIQEKRIIWGISPWSTVWSMGKEKGYRGYYYILKAFVNAGYETHLFCLNDSNLKNDEFYEGIYIHRFKVPLQRVIRKLQIRFMHFKILGFFGNQVLQILFILLYAISSIRRVLRYAIPTDGQERTPSLIYAYSGYDVLPAYILSRHYHISNITRLFGTYITSRDFKLRLLTKWQEIIAFKMPCKYLIVLNDGTQGDKVAKMVGVPNERLKFWYDGVDKKMYNPDFNSNEFKKSLGLDNSVRIILTLSRLVNWKHLERIINAMPHIISEFKNVVLLIVGDGPERKKLEKISQNLDIKKYVKFAGSVNIKDTSNYMNAADIFVSVNDVSNVSNGLLEAMVCGKCIVTLDVGDTKKVIKDNETGKLISKRNQKKIITDLSKTVIDILKDEDLRKKLGNNARVYAERHFKSWEERMDMEMNLIKSLIKHNNYIKIENNIV
ncbi:MAG: glycosyltransferase family 4 protein [bacterium]|nr:glycosyltransferase family 4 protein [bacterium]